MVHGSVDEVVKKTHRGGCGFSLPLPSCLPFALRLGLAACRLTREKRCSRRQKSKGSSRLSIFDAPIVVLGW